MQQVPAEIWAAFEQRLDQAQVPADQRPDYHKWGRFYFDFCHKYGHSPAAPTSLGSFLTKYYSVRLGRAAGRGRLDAEPGV